LSNVNKMEDLKESDKFNDNYSVLLNQHSLDILNLKKKVDILEHYIKEEGEGGSEVMANVMREVEEYRKEIISLIELKNFNKAKQLYIEAKSKYSGLTQLDELSKFFPDN